MVAKNKELYDKLWDNIAVRGYREYPTWKILRKFITKKSKLLELGPGVRPKIPVKGSYFIDRSENAVKKLNKLGGHAIKGCLKKIPFSNSYFDLVCGFDILEHIKDDQKVMGEVSRVLKKKGKFILSAPLHKLFYDEFDQACGHIRRYDPKELEKKLSSVNFKIIAFSDYGIRLKNKFFNKIGAIVLTKAPNFSIKFQDIFLTFLLKREKKKIKLQNGNISEELDKMHAVMMIAEKMR